MLLSRLNIENLRNISKVDLDPHPTLNYFYGENGAGKTTVLEAISILSRGRSFKTSQPAELTGPVNAQYRVFAESREGDGAENRLGLERKGSHWRARINGDDVRQLSQLSRKLPIVVMEPDSHLIVSGSPDLRRKFLDWGMFHVEPGFLETWRNFSKALKQRNAALRQGREDILDSIDDVLVRHGTLLGEMRAVHAKKVADRISGMLASLKARVRGVEIRYEKGWKNENYRESLEKRRFRDMERGSTSVGPHRADLALACEGALARAVLSRGEQKAFAAAMLLTQAEILEEAGKRPVLLLDDLVSEFDREHFATVLKRSLQNKRQVWVTGTEKPELEHVHSLFHVKQGEVTKLV